MEQKMTGSSMWVLGLVVLALIASPVNSISCEDAATQLLPCLSYLVGNGDATVPAPCCEGAQALNRMISSKGDRQTLCECFKQAAPQMGVKVDRAQQLVKTCQINVGLPVDYNVDCSKYVTFRRPILLSSSNLI
ncbi:hypothetical protein RHSIM_Rhsim02G0104700 [Rhododendron simsii]|uniref:Bifunctional inhibitor/plant lipid transfer protein/seed storage helical domain-containing protein n=1 Tax=Rhododendron simsii TaxID=118357 RepID=A0A834LUP3_RHOSS|nr:hypothetical protein RHSIM_Rhsim02G0104700 [Rhododendron simsii]